MTTEAVHLDRRHRRRQETIEEVLDHAVAIMAEEGVAGLSLGEIARRMGIRPPSLYVYFPSKHALYDALFARGWQLLLDAMRGHDEERLSAGADELGRIMLGVGEAFVRWSVENFAYAQLLFWRPVPGFRPSESAYQPAVELYAHGIARLTRLQQAGLIRPDADIGAVQRDWTVLVSGVVSQQLSNSPEEPYETGRFTTALPDLVGMFTAFYGTTTATRRGHARKR